MREKEREREKERAKNTDAEKVQPEGGDSIEFRLIRLGNLGPWKVPIH